MRVARGEWTVGRRLTAGGGEDAEVGRGDGEAWSVVGDVNGRRWVPVGAGGIAENIEGFEWCAGK